MYVYFKYHNVTSCHYNKKNFFCIKIGCLETVLVPTWPELTELVGGQGSGAVDLEY